MRLPGVAGARYRPEEDWFAVDLDPDRVSLASVFGAVFSAGKKMGRDYFPELITLEDR